MHRMVHRHQLTGCGAGKADQGAVAPHDHGLEDEGVTASEHADRARQAPRHLDRLQRLADIEAGLLDRHQLRDLGHGLQDLGRVVGAPALGKLKTDHGQIRRLGDGAVVPHDHLAGHRCAAEGRERRKHRQTLGAGRAQKLGLARSGAGRACDDARQQRHTAVHHAFADTDDAHLLVVVQRNHLGGIDVHHDARRLLRGDPVDVALQCWPVDVTALDHRQHRGGDHAGEGSIQHVGTSLHVNTGSHHCA